MKIVTINCPEYFLDIINTLVGENGLYPSRSELIRVAVREFLIRELKAYKRKTQFELNENIDFGDEEYIKIPVENEDQDKITEMRKVDLKGPTEKETGKESGFVLKTRVLGTKEEWERSRQCISDPKEARDHNAALGPSYLTKYERV